MSNQAKELAQKVINSLPDSMYTPQYFEAHESDYDEETVGEAIDIVDKFLIGVDLFEEDKSKQDFKLKIELTTGEVWVIDAFPIIMQVALYYANVDCDKGSEDKNYYKKTMELFNQYSAYCEDVTDWIANNTNIDQLEPLIISKEQTTVPEPISIISIKKVSL